MATLIKIPWKQRHGMHENRVKMILKATGDRPESRLWFATYS